MAKETKEFKQNRHYNSFYVTEGVVDKVSEGRDLLYRKWLIKDDEAGLRMEKSGIRSSKVLRRPLRRTTLAAMGGLPGVTAFLGLPTREKLRLIERARLEEMREAVADQARRLRERD